MSSNRRMSMAAGTASKLSSTSIDDYAGSVPRSSSPKRSGSLRSAGKPVVMNPKIVLLDVLLGYSKTVSLDSFREYLTKVEFSIENLEFWEDVQKLKTMRLMKATNEELVAHGEYLWMTYLKPRAKKEINVTNGCKSTIIAEMKLEIFVTDGWFAAQQEVYKLMNSDSWKRFFKYEQDKRRESFSGSEPEEYLSSDGKLKSVKSNSGMNEGIVNKKESAGRKISSGSLTDFDSTVDKSTKRKSASYRAKSFFKTSKTKSKSNDNTSIDEDEDPEDESPFQVNIIGLQARSETEDTGGTQLLMDFLNSQDP